MSTDESGSLGPDSDMSRDKSRPPGLDSDIPVYRDKSRPPGPDSEVGKEESRSLGLAKKRPATAKTLNVSGGDGKGAGGDSTGGPDHVFGGRKVALAPYVPTSYAAAAKQEPKHNKLDTESSTKNTSGKALPVEDTGKIKAVLTSRQHNTDDGTTIAVTFKVLLSSELMLPDTKLGIVFGQPLSDWHEVRVVMSEEPAGIKFKDDSYRLMVGELGFLRELVGRTIPYKYVAFLLDRVVKYEYIHLLGNGKADRCLIVPQVEAGFTKYDDVILGEDLHNRLERLRKGRSLATVSMLPRRTELADPQFNVEAALATFEAVVRAHGPDGTKICIANRSYRYTLDQVADPINAYMGNLIKSLQMEVNNNSSRGGRNLLRSAVYICLIGASKLCSYAFSPEDSLLIFEAFFLTCEDQLEQESAAWSMSLGGEVCDALKQLVTRFVHLPGYKCTRPTLQQHGNWIAVMPFIHRWDVTGATDTDWLDLRDWKMQHRFR